jgi:hypothetical protein
MRKPRIIGNPNALQKLAHVDPRAVKQQGTTRTLFHYLPYGTDRTYEFFVNLNNSLAIFKNLEQNKLTEGEALVIKRILFPALVVDALDKENVTAVYNYQVLNLANLLAGRIDIVVGNQTVVKDLPLSKAIGFNQNVSTNYDTLVLDLESEIVLEKDVEFKVILKNCGKNATASDTLMVGLALDGYGKILNLKKNI